MNKRLPLKKLIIKTIFILFIIIVYPCAAESQDDAFISTQKKFISGLYQDQRYFDCISETQRLLDYQKNAADRIDQLYFINTCYFLGGQYNAVISRLQSDDCKDWSKLHIPNLLLLSNSYFKLGDYRKAISLLNSIDYQIIENHYHNNVFRSRVECLLKEYNYTGILAEVEHAENYFILINNSFMLCDFRIDMEKYREIGLKSKWFSAGLSALLPGAGQIYSGRIVDGILTFISVAGTAWAGYYFYNKKEKPLAVTLFLFSGLFYSGNIYGAYNSAVHKNSELNNKFSERIIQKYNLKYDPMEFSVFGIAK
jgi:hypothetical protein